jgi:hypothetical protein
MERGSGKPTWFHNRFFEMARAAATTPGLGSMTSFRVLSRRDQSILLGYYRAEGYMESYMTFLANKPKPGA